MPPPRLRKISRCAIPASERRVGDVIGEAPVGLAQGALCQLQPSSTGTQESGATVYELTKSLGKYSKQILLLRN